MVYDAVVCKANKGMVGAMIVIQTWRKHIPCHHITMQVYIGVDRASGLEIDVCRALRQQCVLLAGCTSRGRGLACAWHGADGQSRSGTRK